MAYNEEQFNAQVKVTVTERNKRTIIVNKGKFRYVKDVKLTGEQFWKYTTRYCLAKIWNVMGK